MSASKAAKSILFTATAQDHHVSVKIKSLLRWLKTGHEVRVQIAGKADRQKAMEGVMKVIEKEVKAGANINQKIIKPESIRFTLKPTKDAVNLVVEEKDSTADDISDLDSIVVGKDVFSDDFEKELERSISDEISKHRKK